MLLSCFCQLQRSLCAGLCLAFELQVAILGWATEAAADQRQSLHVITTLAC